MRRMLFAVVLALLGFAGSALADGAIVRWGAVVGTQGYEPGVSPDMSVAGIAPAPFWTWIEGGNVALDVATGRVEINIEHASIASSNASTPLGSRMFGATAKRIGIFVCDATATTGDLVFTEPFYLDETASLKYRGSVALLDSCRQRPDQIVFLFANAGGTRYFAFGAAQSSQRSGGH